ncbi:MAG: hypothetical protein IKS54_04335 [Erysipelotrichaceae bacterium]|nr:hypothetical protein [Erysipelotrichaceae bacterium]
MLFSKVPAYLIDSENVGSTWTDLLKSDEKFELYICVTENAKSLNFTLLKQLTNDNRHKINIIECHPGKNSLDFYLSSYLGYLIGKGRHSAYVIVSQDTGYDHVIEYWNSEGYDVTRINTKPEKEKRVRKTKVKEKKEEPKAVEKPNSEIRVIAKKEVPSVKENSGNKKKQEAVKKETPVTKKETPEKKKASKKKEAPAPEVKKTDGQMDLLKKLLKDHPESEIESVKKFLDNVPADKREEKNYIYRGLVRKFKREKGLEIYTLIKKDIANYYRLSETKAA